MEGDARLVEYAWADRHLTEEEVVVAIFGGEGDRAPEASVDRVPRFMLDASAFPYDAGLPFVRQLHRSGGFDAVNRAFKAPPRSTTEVLHSERYGSPAPEAPLPIQASPSGCRTERTGVLGEWQMTELLQTQASAPAAEQAVEGWDGDAFGAVRCGTSLGIIERWRSEGQEEAARLAVALATWAKGWSGSTGPGTPEGRIAGRSGAAYIRHHGDIVDLVLSRDAATTSRLSAALAD